MTLQEDLSSLGQWEANWQMKFNVAKCHSMRVTRHQHHKQILFDYSLHMIKLWKMFSRQNTLVSPLQITWIGVSMSQKSLPKQLRHLVSFAGIRLLHLGVQRKLHTKLWFGLNYSMQHPFGALTRNFRLIRLRKFRGQQRAGPAGWRNTSSVGEMLDELEWPSLAARRDQSSLLLFHKIHFGAVSIEKDKYMTPAHSLKTTRSSHSAQYRRHQIYSDALKNSLFPRTIPHLNSLSPSVANTQSTEEFRALLV